MLNSMSKNEKKEIDWRRECLRDIERSRVILRIGNAIYLPLPKCLERLGLIKEKSLVKVYIEDINFEKKEFILRVTVLEY